MKFPKLQFPESWSHYWSKYPEGFTIIESLISWVSQVNKMTEVLNKNQEEIAERVTKKELKENRKLDEKGDFTGTWFGVPFTTSDIGMNSDFNESKKPFPTLSEKISSMINNINSNITNIATINEVLKVVNTYNILSYEKNVINKSYPYGDVRRYSNIDTLKEDLSEGLQNAVYSGVKNIILPYGNYQIKNSVIVPSDVSINFNKSTIMPKAGGSFLRNHIILLNDNGTDWITKYPTAHPIIENLNFSNPDNMVIKGIYCATQGKVQNISSDGMYGTITKTGRYLDMLDINTIDIGRQKGDDYQIVIQGLGDGLKISRIHSHDWLEDKRKLLNVIGCNGGSIEEIINGDILIQNSTALNIRSLHLERGQLICENSSPSISDMYVWVTDNFTPLTLRNTPSSSNRYTRPVNISNITFIYYDDKYSKNKEHYDIDMSNVVVNMNNCFRAWQSLIGVNQMTYSGIKIIYNSTTPHIFNLFSGINSIKCIINYDKVINYKSFILQVGTAYYLNNLIPTLTKDKGNLMSGNYFYRVQIVVDKERKIGRNDTNERTVNLPESNACIELLIGGTEYRNGVFTRIYRGQETKKYNAVADVPQIGGELILDNGISINGELFKIRESSDIDTLNFFEQVEYVNDNARCYGTNIPTSGIWKKGDIIINTNITNGQPISWICTKDGETISDNWKIQNIYS